jgi:hypothetical protein
MLGVCVCLLERERERSGKGLGSDTDNKTEDEEEKSPFNVEFTWAILLDILENVSEIEFLCRIDFLSDYMIMIILQLLIFTSMKHSLLLFTTFSACAQLFRHPV